MSPPTAAPATSNGAAASGGSDENNKHTGSKPPTSPSASGGAGGGGAGLPRPAGVVRSATAAGQPPSASGTAASGAASSTGAGAGAGHGGGHGGHRRVYSAVEGSLAQQALLEGTAGLVLGGNLDLSGMSLSDASNAGNAGVGVGSSGGNGSGGGDKQDDKDATTGAAASAADVTSWNELAQTQGELLKSDHEQQARQEEEAAVFAQEALGEASAEEDVEVISSPKAAGAGGAGGSGGIGTPTRGANYHPEATPDDELSTPKTVGGTLVPLDADGRLLLDRADGIPTPGLPPLSSSSSVQPSSRVPYGAAAGGGGGGMSVTSSTRSIPGSLVRPSGIDTAAGTIGGATAAASRAYSDIIEDEKADHRDTEDLEGLSIGYDGSMMEDDDNNSIISGVTTWMPLADAVGGGGIGGGGDDNRSIKSGASRKGGGKRGKRLDDVDETSRSPPSAAAVARAAAVAAANASAHASSNAGGIGGGGALPSALLRRSSAASSKDGGESGYVSSASGGAVSNDAFLQAMRAGAGAGAGTGTGGASAHHRVTASSVTDRTSGGGSARKSALRHHHHHQQQPHHPHGRAHSPSARDTQSPLSLDELPVTPTRTGGSIQGSLSNLGTAGGGGGVGAAPLAAAPVSSTAAAAGTGGGTSDLLLNAINDLRGHVDRTLDGVRDQNRSDFEKVLAIMQNESSKRSALESRLHAQLLLQSEAMVAMEMKLLRLEAKVEGKGKQDQHAHHHQQHQHRAGSGIGGGSSSAGPPVSVLRESGFATGGPIVSSLPPISSERPYEEDDLGSLEDGGVPRAVRASRAFAASGASLASAVTDGFTVDDASTKSERDESTAQGEDGGDVSVDGSDSTAPTFSSRHRTLDSILMDPEIRGDVSVHGTSTRATRGSDDGDGDSTLATSMTSTTRGSTVLTGVSTRAGESINVRALSGLSEANEYDHAGSEDEENPSTYGINSPANDELSQRSTSSPLTVQSRETAASISQSIASHSVAASQISTAVVAPHRSRAYRRAHDRAAAGGAHTRPLANRLVQFTTAPAAEPTDGADEVTVPEELDNVSDVAETFARSANQWREEYEARLDAIQKRYGNDPEGGEGGAD